MAYVPLVVAVLLALFFVLFLCLLSALLGPKKPSSEKLSPYECGVPPKGEPRGPFSVRFYTIAMLFILFDIEVAFLFPGALLFRSYVNQGIGWIAFAEMAIFIGILVIGLLYAWAKGALEWE